MITEKDVQRVAALARINLAEKEGKKFQKDLSSVLGYIEKLNEVDTARVNPLYQTTGLVNATRPDEYRKDFVMDETLNELLIGQAPHTQNRFINVKSVLQKSEASSTKS